MLEGCIVVTVRYADGCWKTELVIVNQRCTLMQERVALARYCHLPVGNMTGDWILNTADALYARCLRDADHLLWAVDSSLPDVAGPANAQEDTSRFLLEQPTMEVCNTWFSGSSCVVCKAVCEQVGMYV